MRTTKVTTKITKQPVIANDYMPIDVRKTVYAPNMPKIVFKIVSKHGYNNTELAAFLGVTRKCIDNWCNKYPEFENALQTARDIFKSNEIEVSLLQLCQGYEYTEKTVKQIKLKGYDPDSGIEVNVPAEEITTSFKKQAPNIKAIQLWLTNRNRERWKADTKEAGNTTNINIESQQIANVSELSTEQLLQLKNMITAGATKQIIHTAEIVP